MKNNIFLILLPLVFLVSCAPAIGINEKSVFPTPILTQTTVSAPLKLTPKSTPVIYPSPTQRSWYVSNELVTFNDMAVLSNNEVWAIGQKGMIIHDIPHIAHLSDSFDYPGEFNFAGHGYLSAIDFVSKNDGWLTAWCGQIFHWDGKSWKANVSLDLEKCTTLLDVDCSKTGVCWVAGCDRNSSVDGNDIAVLRKWDGRKWKNISLTDEVNSFCLTNIDVVTDNDVWVIGDKYEHGVLLHWDGISWKEFPTPPLVGGIAVGAISTGKVWVFDGNEIYYWDNIKWTQTKIPIYFWYSENDSAHPRILAISQNNVWIGGRGLYHWDGNEWQNKDYDDNYGDIVDIETDPNGGTWALTLNGTILRLND